MQIVGRTVWLLWEKCWCTSVCDCSVINVQYMECDTCWAKKIVKQVLHHTINTSGTHSDVIRTSTWKGHQQKSN